MSLTERIQADYLTAYKAKDALRLSVLRHLKTAATNLAVELKRDITDSELMDIVLKQAKQRQDSIEQFKAGAREDLAAKEEAEFVILKEYLPEMLDGAELEAVVDEAIFENNATTARDMGKVMSTLMEKYKGRFDGKAVSSLVRSKLQS